MGANNPKSKCSEIKTSATNRIKSGIMKNCSTNVPDGVISERS